MFVVKESKGGWAMDTRFDAESRPIPIAMVGAGVGSADAGNGLRREM